ncbi:MAG: HAD-IA family hydrolase [Sideroxydans sp.]|nr:HAD-IA family hydrolase [Sideroxydans sp.]
MIKGVLFDLDGTFADTAPDLAVALNHVRELHDLPPLPLATIRPQASHGSAGLLSLGFGVTPEDPRFDALRIDFLAYYNAHLCVHSTLFPGMSELIDELERRGLKWGIVTNKPHRFTVPLIRALGYERRAACMVSGDTCAHAKPHPLPLLHAAATMHFSPASCLYLGDDLRDMQAAQAAGMRGIVANYGYLDRQQAAGWPAQGAIDSPPQLLQYL